jgi:hypothetical protein
MTKKEKVLAFERALQRSMADHDNRLSAVQTLLTVQVVMYALAGDDGRFNAKLQRIWDGYWLKYRLTCTKCSRVLSDAPGVFDNGQGVCNVCLNQDAQGNDPCECDAA